jgi:predicted secreted Zn-dependent protease
MRSLRGHAPTKFTLICLMTPWIISCASMKAIKESQRPAHTAINVYDGFIPNDENTDETGFLRPYAEIEQTGVKVRVEPYSIVGDTPYELIFGVAGMLPKTGEAKREFAARVDWHVTWSYQYESNQGLCRAYDIKTDLDIKYTLPNWTPPDDVSSAFVDYWKRFEAALWTHELGHAKIGYQAYNEVTRALSELTYTHPDCDQVGKVYNAVGNALTDLGWDAVYDLMTQHGDSQGATFNVDDANALIAADLGEPGELR